MSSIVHRIFSPLNNDQSVRQHLLWWVFVRALLFTLLFVMANFVWNRGPRAIIPPFGISAFFLVLVYIFSAVSGFLIPKNPQKVRQFGMFQLICDAIIDAAVVYGTGCSNSGFIALMILPVITGGLIFDRLGALFLAAISSLLFGCILMAEYFFWFPQYFLLGFYQRPATFFYSSNLFTVYGVIFFCTALLSGHLARRLRVAEEKLSRTSKAFTRLSTLYKQIFDDTSTGIITCNNADCITSANQAAILITGFDNAALLGQPFNQIFPNIGAKEEQDKSVCDFTRKDGTAIRLWYSLSTLNTPADEDQDIPATKGKVITLQDISQMERLEKQIRDAEKLAVVGELSASIAHDFRNPLASISGAAQILAMEKFPQPSMDAETFNTLTNIILRESARMAKTITDFLQFARPISTQFEWFDLNLLVNEVLAQFLSGEQSEEAGRIHQVMDVPLPLLADRHQINVLLSHLLENACAAVKTTGGSIVITAERTEKGIFSLEIADEGNGIPPELRQKVLEPFFTNRPDGSGLGLAIVHQIIERHHGTLTILSNQPQGCIVRVELPPPVIP